MTINKPLSIPPQNIRKPLEKENEDQLVAEKGKRIMKLDLKIDECPKGLWFKNCDFAYCMVLIMLFGKINVSSFGSFGKYHQFWVRLWIFNGKTFSTFIPLIFVLLYLGSWRPTDISPLLPGKSWSHLSTCLYNSITDHCWWGWISTKKETRSVN